MPTRDTNFRENQRLRKKLPRRKTSRQTKDEKSVFLGKKRMKSLVTQNVRSKEVNSFEYEEKM